MFEWVLHWSISTPITLFPPAPWDDPLHVSVQECRPGGLYQSAEVLSWRQSQLHTTHTWMDYFSSLSLLLTVSLSHTHKLRQLSPPFELLLPQQLCKFPTPHTYINTQTSHISIKLDTLVGLKLPLLSYIVLRRHLYSIVRYYANVHICVVLLSLTSKKRLIW